MKHTFVTLLVFSLLLSGCAASVQEPTAPASRVAEPTETTQEATVDPTLSMLNAYEHVMEKFYSEHLSPDGQSLWMDGGIFGSIEENSFAIADVDGDGTEELIILFSTAPMAGMCAWICGYDAQTDAVYQKLSVFPAIRFYTGGLLIAEWSHNQGLAGDALWPYALMQYDPQERSYKVIAQVDAWDSHLSDTDYEGKPFPTDADTDKTGVLYLITQETEQGTFETDTVSRSVYEAWFAGIMGDAAPIEPEYLHTTADNIHAISPIE